MAESENERTSRTPSLFDGVGGHALLEQVLPELLEMRRQEPGASDETTDPSPLDELASLTAGFMAVGLFGERLRWAC